MRKRRSAKYVLFATIFAAGGCADELGGRNGDGDGTAPVSQAGEGEPGSYIANFQLTFYWVTNSDEYNGPNNTAIKKASCSTIATVPSAFASALKLEGTGKLPDGRIVNYHKSCGCSSYGCYVVAGDEYPWGIGVQNRPLHPMRSIAVDKNRIAYGSWVYAPELDGYEIPDGPWGSFVHDGCLRADDTGSAINGYHIDFFAGYKKAYQEMVGDLGSKTKLYKGGTRCTDATVNDDPPGNGDGDGDGDGGDPPDDLSGKACFPGANGAGDTCLDVVNLPPGTSGYDYPNALGGNSNYREPIAYLDLSKIDGSTKLAKNFALNEIAQEHKGRYAVVQPHAVEGLQKFRDSLGAIRVNSGYRNPTYNKSVGGATHSRHMYGDAFDLKPLSTSLTKLENACTAGGGKLVEYNSHVHCDFRFDAVDPTFYGVASGAGIGQEPQFGASIEESEGEWSAVDLAGFDEGEPSLRWSALDADGNVLEEHRGPTFVPPAGTATVRALVGAQVEVEQTLGFSAG
ncbi:MAG: D-Ala-D-Ala carboxypeptidase family metallohydrolase [Myxococcota bacterium]